MVLINTTRSVFGNPDVNSQGQIDEDGDGESVGVADDSVNDTSAKTIDEGDEDEEGSIDPSIIALNLSTSGDGLHHIDITAIITTESGRLAKRLVVNGPISSANLATLIRNIGSW